VPSPSVRGRGPSAGRPGPGANGRNLGKRVDSRATRQRLLAALRRLLDHGHPDLTLQTVAEEAGVSTATAYRYFGSVEDAVLAYILRFPDEVAVAFGERDQGETGLARLALWCRTWVELVDEGWGTSLVYLRSPEGFLARRAQGEAVISAVCRHVEPLMREALEELGTSAETVEVALFLWNAIYDPREILDLRRTLRWTRAHIEQGLWAMFLGSLRGYDSAV
jgi:AcrR family transcriptional regulator